MVHVGTSGYSYPEWRGSFYPERFPGAQMLPYYAERFGTVELNNTFYRMPTVKTIAGWDRDTPVGFVFALKAPRRITHDARLRDEFSKLVVRRPQVLRFLPRMHPINRALGRLRHLFLLHTPRRRWLQVQPSEARA